MRFAYADPPYLGCCALYGHHHGIAMSEANGAVIREYGSPGTLPWDGRCWDDLDTHAALIARLSSDYPDGWALSATSVSLRVLLPLCPPDVRVAAWAKSFCAFKRGVRPAYAWEPVIFWRGRNPNAGHPHAPPPKGGKQNTPKDFIVEPITLKKGLTGAKPARVCEWVLDLLGFRSGDECVDLFPGAGAMSVAVNGRSAA